MNNLNNFSDDDIELFCHSYKQHLLSDPLLNSKIPVWVEFLKTKKHYRENGMEEDVFFNKRFRITQEDLISIHKLIQRVKKGKTLTKQSKSNIRGTDGNFSGTNCFDTFDENAIYDSQPKFELMNELEPALNAYNKKMKKHQQRNKWKQSTDSRVWDPLGYVQDEPDRYYTEDMYSSRPQVEFDVQDFARCKMFNMNKTNIIQKIDEINEILDSNNLITNEFDTDYKRAIPNINSKKKVQFTNHIDNSNNLNNPINPNYTIGNNNLTNENRNNWKFGNGMISGLEQGLNGPSPNKYNGSPEATRLWQDVNLLSGRGNTRKSGIDNRNSFEHQFQYLDGNYNRVPDPRIIGTSSRTENRTTFKR